ncbi:hypothetical protein [Aminipila sp.]|uniref:hypothetical protein n=1 Tax=Aminipila sp. TaxID=2060095 RepID=UPI0028A05642|nr:hypothetical protein [Aminipila sp.]
MGELETIITFLPKYLVCIDKSADEALEGRLYCGYSRFNGVKFTDLHELLLLLEEIMDRIQCPGAGTNMRAFKEDGESVTLDRSEIREAKKVMRKFDTGSERGEKATFILQIKFRQNASWQGTVQWVEKKQSLNFRSALELIKIIDSACEQGYQANIIELKEDII